MSNKPTSYQLLKDTHAIVSDLRKEMGGRMDSIETRIDVLEDFKGKMIGIVTITSVIISGGITWIWRKITS